MMEPRSVSPKRHGRKTGHKVVLACGLFVPVLSGPLFVSPASAAGPVTAVTAEPSTLAECATGAISSTNPQPKDLGNGVKLYQADCSAGPWRVRILTVNPKATGASAEVTMARPGKITDLKYLSDLIPKGTAIAGVNGGYFVRDIWVNDHLGTAGESAGLSVDRGEVLSEATNGRAVLALYDGGRGAKVQKLTSTIKMTVTNGGKTLFTSGDASGTPWIDGLNRPPGEIRNCGGADDVASSSDNTAVAAPWHDHTCVDDDELVLLTSRFGSPRPGSTTSGPSAGTEIVMDTTGNVLEVLGSRGGPVTASGAATFLQGTEGNDKYATWLRNLKKGDKVTYTVTLTDDAKKEVKLTGRDSIVNGGPVLVRNGAVTDLAAEYKADGLDRMSNKDSWIGPNPRTLVGLRTSGEILLVTVDKKNAAVKAGPVGATIAEAAATMKALGVQDAINLDGGGSTTMVTGGTVVNHPSDKSVDSNIDFAESARRAQRLVADAVVITAK